MGELLETLCIRVPKVYDWVQRQISFGKTFSADSLDLDDVGDCLADFSPHVSIRALLSDKDGNPINPTDPNAIQFREISNPLDRKPQQFVLEDGEVITLFKVKLLISGYYVVEICDSSNNAVTHCPRPPKHYLSNAVRWMTTETFYLCAPEGTDVVAHLTSFDGEGTLGFDSEIDLDISLCLEVQMERDVKVEVEGRFISPRPELEAIITCPPAVHPPQCPEVFPGEDDC